MSDAPSTSSETPLAKILNLVLMLGLPALLLGMLGLTGFAFVAGMGDPKHEPAEAEGTAGAAAPVGGGAPGAPAPAVAQADALPEGVTEEFWKLGKSTYANCAACHGPDGQGLQAGPAKMAPTMTGSEVMLGDPDRPILVVLKGIQKENMDYLGLMAALGAGLNDEQIAAVLTYCRNSFGNTAPAVTTEQVAAARAKFASVDAPAGVKRSEIDSIVAGAK